MLDTPTNSKEAKRYRVSPQDIQALERRARDWPHAGSAHDQARAVYQLHLDFLRAAVFGHDYPRWLAQHSGLSVYTCYYRMRLGIALAILPDPDRPAAQLLAELRERERTPLQVEAWFDEPTPVPRRRNRKRRRSRVKRKRPSRDAEQDLIGRARDWAATGHRTRTHADTQALALLNIRRDFQSLNLGRSFPRWFTRVTGYPTTTLRRYLRNLTR